MRLFACRACFSGLMLIFANLTAHAGDKTYLFQSISDALPKPGVGAIAEHLVALDAASLRDATSLVVNVPGSELIAEREDFESRPAGGYRWYGRIDAMNDILITSDGRRTSVTIDGTNGRWTVRPFGTGSHLLTIVDTSYVGPPDEVVEPPAPGSSEAPLETSLPSVALETDTPHGDGVSYIDFLILYTVEARDWAGGHDNIRSVAEHQIDRSNLFFANSLVPNVRYRLRHVAFSGITSEGLTAQQVLDVLTARPGLAQMRNSYGADTAILVTGPFSNFIAGIAWIQRAPGPSHRPFALGAVVLNFLSDGYVFAHEAGHILGMEHNPENSGATPATASFPWSFGHRTPLVSPAPPDPGFITIMSYFGSGGSCGSPCSRIPYFSNPDIALGPPYVGLAAGIPDQRDNARTARLIGSGNSQFYPETDVIFVGDQEYMP